MVPDLKYICEDSNEAGFWNGWDTLKDYLRSIEDYLKNTKERFDARVYEKTKTFTAEQIREFEIDNVEEIIFNNDELPYIVRSSFLVSAYSLFEGNITKICKILKDSKHLQQNLQDLRGDLLERVKEYYKLANIKIIAYNSWQEINNYSKVRNCIVHRNGILAADKKDPIGYCKAKGLIKERRIITDGADRLEIGLTEQYCKEVVDTMQKFIDTAYKDSIGRLQK